MISSLDITLSRCRSKRIISDPEEIISLIHKRGLNQRMFAEIKDGENTVTCRKPTALTTKEFGQPNKGRLRRLVEARGMEFVEEMVGRTMNYFMSDERVDGEGDIIRQNWLMAEFSKNSPMPYSHEWHNPPIGRVIDWGVVDRSETDFNGKALWGLGLFAHGDPRAESIFNLVKNGFLPSGSVGFMSGNVIDVTDDQERNELGLGQWGLVFDKNSLLEFSPTTIPANPGAHIAASMGKLNAQDVDVLRAMKRKEIEQKQRDPHLSVPMLKDEFKAWDKWITDVAKSVFGKTTVTIGKTMDEEETKNEEETKDGATLQEVKDLLAGQGEILAELIKAFNTLVTDVKSGIADVQTSLDNFDISKGVHDDDEEEDEEDDKNKNQGGDYMASLRGSLGDAVRNLEGLQQHVGS